MSEEHFGIHVRLVRDRSDIAIHEAEDEKELPSETLDFQTFFYDEPSAAMEDYLHMRSLLDQRYCEENHSNE